MEAQLVFLLLPFAALSGWWIGRKELHGHDARPGCRDEYFRGLYHLINEQPDKAIQVFVRMVEVEGETIDIHFALGSLFRRRGEVERAIRIHQNLIARPVLNRDQRNQALLELARDYQSAGLLDRAEGLYRELIDDRKCGLAALRQLVDIYQQERDWEQAINAAERLLQRGDHSVEVQLAHYHCELAEVAIGRGAYREAEEAVKRAPRKGHGAVRAGLLEAEIALASNDGARAVKALCLIEHEAPEFVPEILGNLRRAYKLNGRDREWLSHLQTLAAKHKSTSVVLALCEEMESRHDEVAAERVLREFLTEHPSVAGMEKLMLLKQQRSMTESLAVLAQIAQKVLQAKPRYRCGHCGFAGRTLYWQCPGCKRWGTIKPIYGIEGE